MQTEARTAEPLVLALEPEAVRAPAIIRQEERPAEARAPLPAGSPLDQLQALLARGITLDQVRQYLDLQREWEAEEARHAYHRAMAAFKTEDLPTIYKDQHVRYQLREGGGEVEYFHEELAQVVAAIVPAMAKHGLSHKWVPLQEKGHAGPIRVTCTITHAAGYSESTWLEAMPDNSGKKNAIQSVKSTISYLERILLLAATGTAAKGMDDDGRASGDLAPQAETMPRGKPHTEAPHATSSPSSAAADPEFSRGYDQGDRAQQRAGAEREIDQRPASEKQRGLVGARLRDFALSGEALAAHLEIPDLEQLRRGDIDEALQWIKNKGR